MIKNPAGEKVHKEATTYKKNMGIEAGKVKKENESVGQKQDKHKKIESKAKEKVQEQNKPRSKEETPEKDKARMQSVLMRKISTHTPKHTIAVIDTETNWYDEVMSIGIALADAENFKCVGARYYIIDPEYRKGGMYSGVLNIVKSIETRVVSREQAMADICNYLQAAGAGSIFAYNAKFDYGHLSELSEFEWFDIMRLAAYKQYNNFILDDVEICRSGRMKRGYSVENILRMISGDTGYCETHNAVMDAVDELKIMELLGQKLNAYECARL